MKFVTIFDEKTKDVIAQFSEDEAGNVEGICSECVSIIIDGELLSNNNGEDKALTSSSAMACSCGIKASELEIIKTLTSYISKDGLSDVETEYKVVCPNCGKSGDLARSKEGAIISWNENIIKEKINDIR